MDSKTLSVLEYPKILERLAAHCAFSASADLARKLEPSTHLDEVQRLQAETSEARRLIAAAEASIGGAHDVRPAAELARRGGVIEPTDMLDIKSTLISARNLKKAFEKTSKGETEKSPSSPALSRSTLEGPPQGEGSPLSPRERVRVREKTHAPENPYPRLSEIASDCRLLSGWWTPSRARSRTAARCSTRPRRNYYPCGARSAPRMTA